MNETSGPAWKKCSLLSLADYHNGAAFNPSHWGEEGLPIIRIEQINDPSAPTDFYNGQLIPQNFITTGDLIFSWSATLKVVIWRNGDGALNQHLFKVIPKNGTDKAFLKFVLEHNMERLSFGAQGSTMRHITRRELQRYNVAVPTEDAEQSRIADILSTLDQAIEETEALIAKYQQIKAGLMHDLFTRGVTPDGHLRSSRDEAPHLYKQSLLGWIPTEWEVAKLRDKSYRGRPHIKTGPFGSSLKGEHWVEHGHPVITIGALGEGELLPEGLLFVSEATAQRLREYQLEPGDVVFSRVADVGRSAVICEQHDGWIMSSNLMRISLDRNLIVPSYLQSQFAFDFKVKAQIRTKVNSGGRDVANGQVLNQLLFAWPRRDEQGTAMQRITAIDTNRLGLAAERAKLVELKQGLMHDLLTGRVRVNVDGSEVA